MLVYMDHPVGANVILNIGYLSRTKRSYVLLYISPKQDLFAVIERHYNVDPSSRVAPLLFWYKYLKPFKTRGANTMAFNHATFFSEKLVRMLVHVFRSSVYARPQEQDTVLL